MKHEEALKILQQMQLWRRGDPPYELLGMPYTPQQYGEALDVAIELLKEKGEHPINHD
tara:strand:+ start:3826 stop:3999 length:174 start_codon:yes stop_codon:yes gene_type:complete